LVPFSYADDQDEEEEEIEKAFSPRDNEVIFRNPLAEMDDDDLYISENELSYD
jgi:hypothetical protein